MSTTAHIRTGAAAALLLAATVLALPPRPALAQPGGTCGGPRTLLAADGAQTLHVSRTLGSAGELRPAYGWPLKPFDRQHPVRAFLDDPRVGAGGSTAFHFGIDITGADGTPVYAVEAGTAYVHGQSVAVAAGKHVFGYWHVIPAVQEHAFVRAHQLVGTIAPGWLHVHFAERLNGVYLNPLRPGGLGPYRDGNAPFVGEIALVKAGPAIQVLADAYDMPSPRVPAPWTNEPVAPALVEWRVVHNGVSAGGWKTAVDFRSRMLDSKLFHTVYAPPTRQNHPGAAGLYCFYLAHAWVPGDGAYRIQVRASDTRDNRAVAQLAFTVSHGEVRR
jgi:hypothetical protein